MERVKMNFDEYRVKAGFYGELSAKDFWNFGKQLIGSGWAMTKQGKLTPMFDLAPAVDSPWCHAAMDKERDCLMWHKIQFDIFGLLPSNCMECWKVVSRPNSLEQLFAQYELQKKLGYASKSGIEVRNYVHGLYGGYWYTNSLDEGQARWKEVKDAIHAEISPDIEVVLKRACTEMELKYGRSDRWQIPEGQLEFEEIIYEMFDMEDQYDYGQTPEIMNHIQQRWIEWGYQNGDPTSLKYLDGQTLWPETIKYHDLDLSKLKTQTVEVVKKK